MINITPAIANAGVIPGRNGRFSGSSRAPSVVPLFEVCEGAAGWIVEAVAEMEVGDVDDGEAVWLPELDVATSVALLVEWTLRLAFEVGDAVAGVFDDGSSMVEWGRFVDIELPSCRIWKLPGTAIVHGTPTNSQMVELHGRERIRMLKAVLEGCASARRRTYEVREKQRR